MQYETGMRSGSIGQATPAYDMPNKVLPPQPTIFSRCAAKLEAQVAHVTGLVERASRVADRLGGPIPQPVDDKKIGGNGGHIAAQMEISMELFDGALRRFEQTLERLEAL